VSALAGVVLAAGRGVRLRPLTDVRPKALCPIANRPLVDLALDRVAPMTGSGPEHLAVNTHHLSGQLRDHLGDRVHLSDEQPAALGTAGALGALRPWIDGRAVLVTNADAYLPDGVAELGEGWDGRRMRLLCKETGHAGDFGSLRYVGACLLPWAVIAPLEARPSGLYDLLWAAAAARGELELVPTVGRAIDCGRASDYLAANLDASGGASVVGDGARVDGTLDRCVVWPGAVVEAGEQLVECIRAGTASAPLTVDARPPVSTT
jgi:MurNAc alpha-1-phosphate uridylyltransferase